MASGAKPQDSELKQPQEINKQYRKDTASSTLKHKKKGLKKYGVHEIDVALLSWEHREELRTRMARIRGEINAIGICFDCWQCSPEWNKKAIRVYAQTIYDYCYNDNPMDSKLQDKFVNKLMPMVGFMERGNARKAQRIWKELLQNFDDLWEYLFRKPFGI